MNNEQLAYFRQRATHGSFGGISGDDTAKLLNEIDRLRAQQIDIVFDGPPSHESGRFVEVENLTGQSISVGQWIDRGNGMWALRINGAASGESA